MIAIDWSHIKGLTTYDGHKVRVETTRQFLARISKTTDGGESNYDVQSIRRVQSPSVVLERGCPMSLIYNLSSHNIKVKLIDNHLTETYRQNHGIEKNDENDAKIIYTLALNGAKAILKAPNAQMLKVTDLYHQYCKYQKARVAMQHMKTGHLRQYGLLNTDNTSKTVKPSHIPDMSPYDKAIKVLQAKELIILNRATKMLSKQYSKKRILNNGFVQPPTIKGLGKRIWLGFMVTANPTNFKCLSAYLRFCGLTNDVILNHNYSRHARMLCHMLAEQTLRHNDPIFRPIYDKCKTDIALVHPDYTKKHTHNASLNRTATFLAKSIYKYCKQVSPQYPTSSHA